MSSRSAFFSLLPGPRGRTGRPVPRATRSTNSCLLRAGAKLSFIGEPSSFA